MRLGDLQIIGGGELPPARLIKALAVISHGLHPFFDAERWGIPPGKSKGSCVLCSLTVRDFLWRVGFKDAAVAPCYFMIHAYRGDKVLHSLGIGDHDSMGEDGPPETAGSWSGHMVVKVDGWLIDTTLYQAHREPWADLPGMMVAQLHPTGWMAPLRGFQPIAGGGSYDGETLIEMVWLDQPGNERWRRGGASGGDVAKERRVNVVRQLVRAFRAN